MCWCGLKALLFVCLLGLFHESAFAAVWWPDPDYAFPDKESAPDWLKAHKLNFSRWDGGPIETCKGMLSGWPYFNAPWPSVIDATNHWYDLKTVDLAQAMGYNFLWLTFSVGYSIEQEQYQWEILRPYIKECHKRDIRVAAYMSSCNMFVDEMFEAVPESKEWLLLDAKGEPVPYGAAAYKRMGRTTRMLADITDPRWKEYLKKRIDAAIDLGFDAIEYDNTYWAVEGKKAQERYAAFLEKNGFQGSPEARSAYQDEVMRRLFPELMAHARQRKPDIAFFININRPQYAIERGCTIIATEDGFEPGYYEFAYNHEVGSTDTLKAVHEDAFADIKAAAFNPGMLISNIGKLRMLHGLSEGWKPVIVEFGGRRNGHRLLNHYPPLAFQLAIAECNASLCSLQGYQEGLALRDLFERRPEVLPIVDAAGKAHQFVSKYEECFVGAQYRANVAIVVDNRLSILKGYLPHETCLADFVKANVQFEVVFEERLTKEALNKFKCVVVYDAKLISDEALDALVAYANGGGTMMVFGETGAMDHWGQPRKDNPIAADGAWKTTKEEKDLIEFAVKNAPTDFEVIECPYVLFTLTESSGATDGGFVAHLLNYQKAALENVRVRIPGRQRVQMLALTPGCDQITKSQTANEWVIPKLGVYSMLVAGS
jgi:hypothetical protein